jgi:hypothetical protein
VKFDHNIIIKGANLVYNQSGVWKDQIIMYLQTDLRIGNTIYVVNTNDTINSVLMSFTSSQSFDFTISKIRLLSESTNRSQDLWTGEDIDTFIGG